MDWRSFVWPIMLKTLGGLLGLDSLEVGWDWVGFGGECRRDFQGENAKVLNDGVIMYQFEWDIYVGFMR